LDKGRFGETQRDNEEAARQKSKVKITTEKKERTKGTNAQHYAYAIAG
jgi:hypothetical protein